MVILVDSSSWPAHVKCAGCGDWVVWVVGGGSGRGGVGHSMSFMRPWRRFRQGAPFLQSGRSLVQRQMAGMGGKPPVRYRVGGYRKRTSVPRVMVARKGPSYNTLIGWASWIAKPLRPTRTLDFSTTSPHLHAPALRKPPREQLHVHGRYGRSLPSHG